MIKYLKEREKTPERFKTPPGWYSHWKTKQERKEQQIEHQKRISYIKSLDVQQEQLYEYFELLYRLPGRSDYLIGHAECAVTFVEDKEGTPQLIRAYPQGEERRAINAVFDKIVAELKLQNILTYDDRIVPELAASSVYQNNAIFEPAVAFAGRASAWDGITGEKQNGTQMTLFDYDGVSDYLEDEEELEI